MVRLFFMIFFLSGTIVAEDQSLFEGDDQEDGIEIRPEDMILSHEILPPSDDISPREILASPIGNIDLVKLWDMLTDGMSPREKKAYARDFVGVVERYQEREILKDRREILALVLKSAIGLAVVGLFCYGIYALIIATRQDTERVRFRTEAEKVAAQAHGVHAGIDSEFAAAKASMLAASSEMREQARRDVAEMREQLRRDGMEMREQVRRDTTTHQEQARRDIVEVKDQMITGMRDYTVRVRDLFTALQPSMDRQVIDNGWGQILQRIGTILVQQPRLIEPAAPRARAAT